MTSVLYLLYVNMFYWVIGLRDSEFLFSVDHAVVILISFLPLVQTDPQLTLEFTTTLFGAMVTTRIWSNVSFFCDLNRQMPMILNRCCLLCLLFLQTSFLCDSKTWHPATEDGLSLPGTFYGTGDMLNTGYIDRKSKYLVSSLNWLSILFHTLSHLTKGWPGYFVVMMFLGA